MSLHVPTPTPTPATAARTTTSTGVDDPTRLHAAWAERFNAADLDGMLALAEPPAIFAPRPGDVVEGEATRDALAGFLSLGLPISMSLRRAIVADGVALLVADWRISGTAPDGATVELAGSTADVARRGSDGWRFAIDNPFGTA